jgi:hypothetical protein
MRFNTRGAIFGRAAGARREWIAFGGRDMGQGDVIFVVLGFLGGLVLFGVFVNAGRRHDFHRRQGRPELH